MEHKYKVTIAIPVYNAAESIERTIMSALNQSFKSIEYLIIDDKGSDNSIEIIKRITRTHKRGKDVRIIDHEINRGIGATKNTAIDNASGEFLYFLDSDDYITPDCIDRLYSYGKHVDCCYGSYITCDKNLKITDYQNMRFSYTSKNVPSLAHRMFCQWGQLYIQTWNKLYKMSFLKENNIRCSPHTNVEDVFFTFQIQYFCKSFCCIPDITYYYLLHSDSTTSGMGGLKYEYALQLIEAYNDIQNFLEKHNDSNLRWGHEQTLYYHNKWCVEKILESEVMSDIQKQELLLSRYESIKKLCNQSEYNHLFKELDSFCDIFEWSKEFINTHPFSPIKKAQKEDVFARMKYEIWKWLKKDRSLKVGNTIYL